METGLQIGRTLIGHESLITSVAFNSDGVTLASGSADDTVRLWNWKKGQQIGEPLIGHTLDVESVAFSPDGKLLASAGKDVTIRLWNVVTGQQVVEPMTLEPETFFVRWISSIEFSPDGKMLASGGYDRSVRLCDVETGQQIGEPLIESGAGFAIFSVAFSPDGGSLASGSSDGAIRLHDTDIESWVNTACNRATRNFTETEWKTFFPGECYRLTCSQWPPECEENRFGCQVQGLWDNLFEKRIFGN